MVLSTIKGATMQALDSLMNLPAIALPMIKYAPETGWVFGAAVQGYFRLPEAERVSLIQATGAYTLHHQWYTNVGGSLYFGGSRPWILQFRGGYRDYPDWYYDIGNTPTRKEAKSYTSKRGYAYIQPLFCLPRHWAVGVNSELIYEGKNTISKEIWMWGLGPVIQYDTRDILYYPTSGLFFKMAMMYCEPKLGSACRLVRLSADLRQYLLLNTRYRAIFAWQAYSVFSLSPDGTSTIPFQMLPTIGGDDLLRGIRSGIFRDNALLALQAELRLPVWNFLYATIFAGVGDVYNTDHWNWTTPKAGYGAGLRVSINKAKITLRFDVARNTINNSWTESSAYSYYFTATEAF